MAELTHRTPRDGMNMTTTTDPTGYGLVVAMKAAIAAVAAFEAPELLQTKNGHLRCPHCRAKNSVQERDYDMRVNEAEFDRYSRQLDIDQGDSEYETICYECTVCEGLVSLPPGVTPNWIN